MNGTHEGHVLVTDIDGVINAFEPARMQDFDSVTVRKPRKVKIGGGDPFIETDVMFSRRLAAWMRDFEAAGGTIIWLTSWEHNAPIMGNLLGVQATEHIKFRHLGVSGEDGKIVAFRDWLATQSFTKIAWIDDEATLPFPTPASAGLPEHTLIVTPDEAEGVTASDLERLDRFFSK